MKNNNNIIELQELNDINLEFIENCIKIGIDCSINKTDIPKDTDLKGLYFVGKTLCLDTEDEFGFFEVICVNHSTETFSSFKHKTGFQRLLSLSALRNLETLMKLNNINFEPKNIS